MYMHSGQFGTILNIEFLLKPSTQNDRYDNHDLPPSDGLWHQSVGQWMGKSVGQPRALKHQYVPLQMRCVKGRDVCV